MIWRIGTEILCNHSRSNIREFNSFIEQMKTLGVKRYLKVGVLNAVLMVFPHIYLSIYLSVIVSESSLEMLLTIVSKKIVLLSYQLCDISRAVP